MLINSIKYGMTQHSITQPSQNKAKSNVSFGMLYKLNNGVDLMSTVYIDYDKKGFELLNAVQVALSNFPSKKNFLLDLKDNILTLYKFQNGVSEKTPFAVADAANNTISDDTIHSLCNNIKG